MIDMMGGGPNITGNQSAPILLKNKHSRVKSAWKKFQNESVQAAPASRIGIKVLPAQPARFREQCPEVYDAVFQTDHPIICKSNLETTNAISALWNCRGSAGANPLLQLPAASSFRQLPAASSFHNRRPRSFDDHIELSSVYDSPLHARSPSTSPKAIAETAAEPPRPARLSIADALSADDGSTFASGTAVDVLGGLHRRAEAKKDSASSRTKPTAAAESRPDAETTSERDEKRLRSLAGDVHQEPSEQLHDLTRARKGCKRPIDAVKVTKKASSRFQTWTCGAKVHAYEICEGSAT